MEVHFRCIGNCVEELLYHLGLKLPDPSAVKAASKRSRGPINRWHRESGLIHGGRIIFPYRLLISYCQPPFDGSAQHDARILDRMVGIDLQIAPSLPLPDQKSRGGQSCSAYDQKADSRLNRSAARSVQVKLQADIRLFRHSFDFCSSSHYPGVLSSLFFKPDFDRIGMCGQLLRLCKRLDILMDGLQGVSWNSK